MAKTKKGKDEATIAKIKEWIEENKVAIQIIRNAKNELRIIKKNLWIMGQDVEVIDYEKLYCCARGWLNYNYNTVRNPKDSTILCCKTESKAVSSLTSALSQYNMYVFAFKLNYCNLVAVNDDTRNIFDYGNHPKQRVLTYLWQAIKFYSKEIKRLQEELTIKSQMT